MQLVLIEFSDESFHLYLYLFKGVQPLHDDEGYIKMA